jgi:hypothetical protein
MYAYLPSYGSDHPRNWHITICLGHIGHVSDIYYHAVDDTIAPIKCSADSTTCKEYQLSTLLTTIQHTDLTTRPRKVFDSPNENIETDIANRAASNTGLPNLVGQLTPMKNSLCMSCKV